MKKNSTFQYVLPKNDLVQLPLKNNIKDFQRPVYKASIMRPSSVELKTTYIGGYTKDFIPSSLTAPHSAQHRNIYNQVKPINIINITPIQQNQQMNNILPLKTDNNIPMINIGIISNNIPPGSLGYNNNLIQNVPIISNNNIINNMNNQSYITNSIKPVPVIAVKNNNTNTNWNPINNLKYVNVNRPNQIQKISKYAPIVAAPKIINIKAPPIKKVPIIQKISNSPKTPIIKTNPITQNISTIQNFPKVIKYQRSIVIPSENLNLNEYDLIGEIGKGSFGNIYKVKWKVDQKYYALKTELLNDINEINQRLERRKAMRNFMQKTGCQGIVNIYGSYLIRQGNDFQYFELMELCDADFEKEIKMRSSYGAYFTEIEFDNIIKQLISTLSFLQQQHITHRDIKPQNILITNGIYKLCDFGDIRVMERDGFVVQRIRGSELYMSPILFNALRQGLQRVPHDTYKSDVFSLGMCLFYAACLSFDGPVEIREITDMNIKAQILNKYLASRYSQKLIKILYLMLMTEEVDRPDFIMLQNAILKYGL